MMLFGTVSIYRINLKDQRAVAEALRSGLADHNLNQQCQSQLTVVERLRHSSRFAIFRKRWIPRRKGEYAQPNSLVFTSFK